jgi:hypothetical protein
MSIGHIVGVGSEFITRPACLALTQNDALCAVVSLFIHEGIVEPIVDSVIYTGLASWDKDFTLASFYNMDPYEFTFKAATSFGASKIGEQLLGNNILVSTVAGVAGGYLAGQIYEFVHPSNHTQEEL